jgi:hypothetical protein
VARRCQPGCDNRPMTRRSLLTALPFAFLASVRIGAQRGATARTITVYKDPSCGCCTNWSGLLQKGGFAVTIRSITELDTAKYAVPTALHSCHTAIVDGHIVEGHVPVADVQRMLRQGDAVYGLSVPGMPIGSPGMEVPSVAAQPYDVIAFDRSGKSRVFASYGRA